MTIKKSYEALELLANRIKSSIVDLELEFQKSIDKKINLNEVTFTMYLSTLINLKNILDYELLKYGGNESACDMEVYKSLESFIYDCRMLVTNNRFEFYRTPFSLKIYECHTISTNDIKHYIHVSLANQSIERTEFKT